MLSNEETSEIVNEIGQSYGETPTSPPPAVEEDIPYPTSWKKDYQEHWATLPNEIRKYANQREKEVADGFGQYKSGYDSWDKTTKPFQEILRQNPNVDPVALLQNMATNHIQLLQGSREDKINLLKQLAIDYGLLEAERPPIDPAITNRLQAVEAYMHEQGIQSKLSEVDTFAAANPHFDEVKSEIITLLKSNMATSLQEAYDKAVWLNPSVRGKLSQPPQSTARQNASAINVTSSPTARSGQSGTITSTIDNIVDKYYRS